ncbi:hypothetical protein BH09VER1_BH09VER1_19290 [soil metagenome]
MRAAPVREVSVIFKTHLDIGFTDLAARVLQRYIGDFIPGALKLARETRHRPERFVWTTGSWLIFNFLEQVPRTARRQMEEAIAQGDFHWHALPFTTHTELMDESLFVAALRYRDWLDERFGRSTRAAKMTDVPGHTRAIVPLLAAHGVRFLHIGVNPSSTAPAVPPVFVWRSDGREIVVMYDKVYGATNIVPGGRAVSVNLTNDNLGPPTAAAVNRIYAALRRQFPQAVLTPGNLSQVADHLWEQRTALPVVTAEIGDTWIHGVGTDPAKVAQFRALSRLRRQFIADRRLIEGSEADRRFAEGLLLVAEHTWGLDVKTHLKDFHTYSRRDLRLALRKVNFKKLASSWEEQRTYLTTALKGLPSLLRSTARTELQAMVPKRPGSKAWQPIPICEPLCLGDFHFEIDPTTGALRNLERGGEPPLTSSHLALPIYQTFSREDFRRFYQQYNSHDFLWARRDFTKVGLPAFSRSAWYTPAPKCLSLHRSAPALLAKLAFPAEAQALGAPEEITLEYDFTGPDVLIRLQWFRKPAYRPPEALWLGFAPHLPRGSHWTLQKLGLAIDSRDVVRGGARSLHAVTGSVTARGVSIESHDSALVAIGQPKLTNFDNLQPASASAIHFNLWNNIWNTNFPQWSAGDALFRFTLKWA